MQSNSGNERTVVLPLVVGAVIFAGLAAVIVYVRSEVERPRETTPASAAVYQIPPRGGEAGYVGSARCQSCHPREHAKWMKSNHTRSVNLPSRRTILADLEIDGSYTFEGRTYTMFERDGGFFMSEVHPDGTKNEYSVDYVSGVRGMQMFLTRMPDGRIQSLPMFREVDQPDHPNQRQRERGGRWFDYSEMAWRRRRTFLTPADPSHWTHQGRNWNERCTDCHISRVRRGYSMEKNTYNTEWLELTVGCEACHGPGSAHVERWTNMAGIPVGRDFPDLKGLSARQSVETCAECHAEKDQIWGRNFLPGRDLFDSILPRLLEDEIRVYPDGRLSELNYNYLPLAQSPCFTQGGLTCVYCHDPHGSDYPLDLRFPRRDDRMCTACHSDLAEDISAHTFHAPRSEGSRCLSCHAMFLTISNGHAVILDHSFTIPSPRNTVRYGIPNACNSCHVRETPQWSLRWMREWYGDRRYRVEEIADIFEPARRKDPKAIPNLVRLVEDPSENLIHRASAARILMDFPDPRVKEALVAGLSDAETLVRVCSILGLIGQSPDGVLSTLRRMLVHDGSLAVRKTAALYLISKGDKQSAPRCRSEMEGLVQTTPTITNVMTSIGDSYFVEGRKKEAWDAYIRVLDVYPFHQGAFRMLASMAVTDAQPHYQAKRYEEALAALGRLDRYTMVSPSLELWRATIFMAQGLRAEAWRGYSKVLEAEPENPTAFSMLVTLAVAEIQPHFKAQRFDKVLASLARLDEFGRVSPVIELWRASAFKAQGKPDEAEAAFRKGVAEAPDNFELQWGLATLLGTKGDLTGAVAASSAALKVRPDDRGVLLYRAQCHLFLKQWDDAARDARALLARNARDGQAQDVLRRAERKGQ